MKATITTETKHYFDCLACKEPFKSSYSHLIPLVANTNKVCTFGPWYCDNCGVAIKGTVFSATEINLEIEESRGKSVDCWDLLVLMPQKHPVYFIVRSVDYRENGYSAPFENKEYFYEEHTCPTNWTREVECIINEKDDDPHGLFEYVRSIEKRDVITKLYDGHNPENKTHPDWEKTFPESFE